VEIERRVMKDGAVRWRVRWRQGGRYRSQTFDRKGDAAVINGAACNGQITSDCRPRVIPAKTGGWPADIGLDPASGTMYVTDNVDGAMSLFRLRRR
jgi:hypothetical protein